MSEDEVEKSSLNVDGRYYVTEECLSCEACAVLAPNNIRLDENYMSYVFKQPADAVEQAQCREALDACCVAAIRDDGEKVAAILEGVDK